MSSDRVIIFDTSLRDGEQAPGAAMTVPEKLQLAGQLARLGVDVIEAGFPISSPGQFEAVRRIVAEVQGPTICALARSKKADIDAAGSALKGGSNTRIPRSLPPATSTWRASLLTRVMVLPSRKSAKRC